MFACIDKPSEQKELFFAIDKLFALEYFKRKVRGIYVIFKDGICLYVGQSENIASRLATHLSGKYHDADNILVFEVSSADQNDLISSEKYAIKYFKPIENVLADYSEIITSGTLAEYFYHHATTGNPLTYSYQIFLNKHSIFIENFDSYFDFKNFDNMLNFISETIKEASK